MYIVREPGKNGGTKYKTLAHAVEHAKQWYKDTRIVCQIWQITSDHGFFDEYVLIHWPLPCVSR